MWTLGKILGPLLLPPLNLVIVCLVGLWICRKSPRFGKTVIGIALALLYLLSTPLIGKFLLGTLETYPALRETETPEADAIVVLSSGTHGNGPEYGGRNVHYLTLERLRYGARLYRQTKKPLLVSGGKVASDVPPDSRLMKETLEKDFQVPVRWIEERSRNTFENAKYSAELLKERHIRRVYLVTHSWHMPRAKRVFQKMGLEVVPAPTGFAIRPSSSWRQFLPDPIGLLNSHYAVREWIGRVWYWIRT